MERWELHKKHDEDVMSILKGLGFCDKQNHIRKWDDSAHKKLAEAGHTSVGFNFCNCGKEKH